MLVYETAWNPPKSRAAKDSPENLVGNLDGCLEKVRREKHSKVTGGKRMVLAKELSSRIWIPDSDRVHLVRSTTSIEYLLISRQFY